MNDKANGIGALIVTSVVAVLSGAVGAFAVVHYTNSQRDQQQPFYVVDMSRAVKTIADNPLWTDAEKRTRVGQAGEYVKSWMKEKVDQGAIVLDGSAVLGAPGAVYVDPFSIR
jgi:hypothetical protein